MISFDVVSLFTNVPLDKTIDIIIKKVYKEKRIKTKIKAGKMRELLYLCTREGHFTFNDETYVQTDGVMMGSPLGSLIANIFMCELETSIIPKLTDSVKLWTRYVDDTFAFVKPTEIENIHRQLNSYDQHIQFTYETETERMLSFLDVMIERKDTHLETGVYRKKTNSDLYMNWDSHSPRAWKIGTLKNLTRRAIMISSPNNLEKSRIIYGKCSTRKTTIQDILRTKSSTKKSKENKAIYKDKATTRMTTKTKRNAYN